MTKEELEKEACEGYIKRIRQVGVKDNYRNQTYNDGYLDGAEPREKYIAELKAQIEKMKWHKVSDGDLPKDRHNVYVVYMNGYCQLEKTIASFRHKYWVINGLKTE